MPGPDSTAATAPALGLRQNGERRSHERRFLRRAPGDRRRFTERRKKQLGGLLIAAAALAAPQQVRNRPLQAVSRMMKSQPAGKPNVNVAIDEVRALRPEEAYEDLIQEAAVKHELDPNLIRAVMRTESAFNPYAVSRVGAQGLMQLMPGLASDMGVTDPFDPRQNIMAGARYLRQLLDAHRGNIRLTLASYNAGPGNVKRYQGIPPFEETRSYVKKITDLLAEAEDTQE
jgi:soluble lytic murein transglycosylase-like protein